MSAKIKRLSEQTINQIAAGEVIENPASVVKELVENSIDAGASFIRVETLTGGQKLIRISDDGSGMEKEDALMSLERHATSKIIEADDLFRLTTMGFRGEALASIAAISCLTLITAAKEGEGCQIEIEGGKKIKEGPSARKRGTTIEVRSLFFNVPARKKFQKSPLSNTSEITRLMMTLSLAHPKVNFELFHQEKPAFSHVNSSDLVFEEALGQRIHSLFGEDFFEMMYPLNWKEKGICLRGWIGSPEQSRLNRTGQYLFVNARPVVCPLVSFAIKDAYGTRIATSQHPFFILHLEVHPSLIDVNVHPQKKEIRFREEDFVRKNIQEGVQKALQQVKKSSFIPSLTKEFDVSFEPIVPLSHGCCIKMKEDNDPRKQERELMLMQESLNESTFRRTLNFKDCEKERVLPLEVPLLRTVGLFSSYLLIEAESVKDRLQFLNGGESLDGILFVDLKAAYARITYEMLLNEKKEKTIQHLLLPHPFSLSQEEASYVSMHEEEYLKMGILLKQVSSTQLIIEGMLPSLEVEDVISVILDSFSDEDNFLTKTAFEDKKKQKLALSLSSFAKARKKHFMLQEALSLFEELLKTPSPTLCPLGKQTVTYVSKDEIAYFFSKKEA